MGDAIISVEELSKAFGCFYNSYYIYRFTLSATHSGG